jgi:hypothetical protein
MHSPRSLRLCLIVPRVGRVRRDFSERKLSRSPVPFPYNQESDLPERMEL